MMVKFARKDTLRHEFFANFDEVLMGPKAIPVSSEELFRARLDGQLNIRHCLIRLAKLINWHSIERQFQVHFTSERGRTVLPSRLVAGLLYLPHTNDASDEVVVATWRRAAGA